MLKIEHKLLKGSLTASSPLTTVSPHIFNALSYNKFFLKKTAAKPMHTSTKLLPQLLLLPDDTLKFTKVKVMKVPADWLMLYTHSLLDGKCSG